MLRITLLGAGGGMPMPKRHLSSLLISYQGRMILIDCGEGTQVAMRRVNSGFKSVDLICLTHFHGDHIFGLPGLLSTIGNSGRTEPIIIVGPKGLLNIVKGLLLSTYLPYDLHLVESPDHPLNFVVSNGRLIINEDDSFNEITLNTMALDHSVDCIGYSFSINRKRKFIVENAISHGIPKELWGKLQDNRTITFNGKTFIPDLVLGEERKGIKLSYVTDTRPMDSIIEFIYKSDLFVCEGTYGDENDLDKAVNNKHMTFNEAAILANKGNVKELLLTHFGTAIDNPDLFKSNATEIFQNTIIGHDGLFKELFFE